MCYAVQCENPRQHLEAKIIKRLKVFNRLHTIGQLGDITGKSKRLLNPKSLTVSSVRADKLFGKISSMTQVKNISLA